MGTCLCSPAAADKNTLLRYDTFWYSMLFPIPKGITMMVVLEDKHVEDL